MCSDLLTNINRSDYAISLEKLHPGTAENDEAFFDPDLPLQLRTWNKLHLTTFTEHICQKYSIKMEWIIFGGLYQAKEGLYFYTQFFIELSIYVARQSSVAFPLYKQAPRSNIRGRFWCSQNEALQGWILHLKVVFAFPSHRYEKRSF